LILQLMSELNIPSWCCAGIKNLPKHCFAIAGVFFFVCMFLPMFRSVCTEQQLVLFCFLSPACTCQRLALCLIQTRFSESLQALLAHLVVYRECIECCVCQRCAACALDIIKAEGHSPSGQFCCRCISSCCTPFHQISKEHAVRTLTN